MTRPGYQVARRKGGADTGLRLVCVRSMPLLDTGAYWHTDREASDWRKSEMIMAEAGHRVVRLREEPLELLHDLDLLVPKRADGPRCATLLVPHLAHTCYGNLRTSTSNRGSAI